MDRYTRKDAERQFERLIKAIGGRVAKSYDDHGAYRLDWNIVYGGGGVERVSKESTGVSQPFCATRKNAREFCDAVHFAIRVLEEKENLSCGR